MAENVDVKSISAGIQHLVTSLDEKIEEIVTVQKALNPDSEKSPLLKNEVLEISLSDSDSSSGSSSSGSEFADITTTGEGKKPRKAHKKVSDSGTIVHLLKANTWTGLLAMPKAIHDFGILAGVIGILILGYIYIYSIHLLFDISKGVAKRVVMDRRLEQEKRKYELLKEAAKKELKKMKKRLKKEAKLKENKDPGKWKENFANDIEIGESSKAPQDQDTPKKDSKEGKENFANDMEIGESSKSPQDQDTPETKDPELRIQIEDKELLSILEKDDNSDREIEIEVDETLRHLDYPKIVELAFHYGSKEFKWAGHIFKLYVQTMMIITHIGCCCVCFLFIAETLSEMPTTARYVSHSSSFILVAYAIPIMICLSFIPDRHELTGVTTIAFLLQIIGVIMMLIIFITGEHSKNFHPYIAPSNTWSLYFGTAFYAFEGMGVTLHLESHMENRKSFRGSFGVFNKGMVIFIVPMFALFGCLGYWKFGDDVKTSVTFNIPEGRFGDLACFMTAMGILLTYPFHFSFVLAPLRRLLIRNECSKNGRQRADLIIRGAFVIFTYFVSALIPYLELQITVLGASTSCFLVLIVPAQLSNTTDGRLPGIDYSCCRTLFHIFILLLGTAGTVLGAYTTIKNLPLYYPNATIFG